MRNSWSFEASRYRIILIATDNSIRLSALSPHARHKCALSSRSRLHEPTPHARALNTRRRHGRHGERRRRQRFGVEVVDFPLLPDASSPPPQRRSRDCAVCPIEGESKASCLRVCRACGFNHAHRHFCATRTRTAPINLLCFVCAMYRCDRV